MTRKSLIIGGAGFIGMNVAKDRIKKGDDVTLLDNLSRKGTRANLALLKDLKLGDFSFMRNDIAWKDNKWLEDAVKGADVIYHLAAQTAVTTSVKRPGMDFLHNAFGTLNVLEAVRKYNPEAILLFSSTNKVYGELLDVPIVKNEMRYEFGDREGIDELQPLDFHSPYGCSKGCADQYVRDYARIYGLRTVVFRQSCIAGRMQKGSSDQGWLYHFCDCADKNKVVTVCGDGLQCRDVLNVDDLVRAYDLAVNKIKKCSGKVFNIGGGYHNSISLLESLAKIGTLFDKPVRTNSEGWRPGDQKVFISDNSLFSEVTGWHPKNDLNQTLNDIKDWIRFEEKKEQSVYI